MRKILVFISVILLGCNTEVPKDTESLLSSIITGEGETLVRGVALGMTLDEVKLAEAPGALTEEEGDYLFYEVQHDSLNSFTVSYSFENNELVEIRLDIYTFNDSAASDLCNGFETTFSSGFKSIPSEFTGFWRWSANFIDQASIIELRDESADYHNVGKVTLLVYIEPAAAA